MAGATAILRAVVTADTGVAEAKLAGVGKTLDSLGLKGTATLSKFGGAAQIAFATAGAAAVAFVGASVKAYEEHQKVLAQLQAQIARSPQLVGASTKAFQDQATALQNLTGVQDEEVLSADTVLARFGLTQTQIQQLIPLILDYSKATGIDAVTAANNIGKALLGNTRALKTVGIQFHATGDTAKDLSTIIGALQQKVGGAAAAFGDTAAGKMEIFKAKLNDLQETVGQAVLPVIEDLISDLTSLVDGFQTATKYAGDFVDKLGAGIPALLGFHSETGGVTKAIKDLIGHAFNPLFTALGVHQTEVAGNTKSQKDLAASMNALGSATTADKAITDADTTAQYNAAAGKKANMDATLALLDAQHQAIGGFLGIEGAANAVTRAHLDVAAAQTQVNKDIKDGLKGTQQYKSDVLALADAQLNGLQSINSLASSVVSYEKTLNGGQVTQAQAIAGVREFAKQFGLTKGQTDALIQSVIKLTDKYDGIPPKKSTQVTAPGLADSIAGADHYLSTLNLIDGRVVDAFFITHYSSTGTPGSAGGIQGERGLVFAPGYQQGSMFLGPRGPFRAGEGAGFTQFGTGAEIVGNHGVLPLGPGIIAQLGKAIGESSSASGVSVVINVHPGATVVGSFRDEVLATVNDAVRQRAALR